MSGKFKEGHDPRRNLGGRPAMSDEAKLAFASMEPIALERLRKILEGDDSQLALRAIETVFERRWGKAVQAVAHQGADGESLGVTVTFVKAGPAK